MLKKLANTTTLQHLGWALIREAVPYAASRASEYIEYKVHESRRTSKIDLNIEVRLPKLP